MLRAAILVIREPNMPDEARKIILDVQMEVYLRGRHDPLQIVGSFYFQREHLSEEDPVESFMGIVASTFRSATTDRSAPLMILSDRNGNTFLIETSELQAVSVLAPTSNTIREAIEKSEEDV